MIDVVHEAMYIAGRMERMGNVIPIFNPAAISSQVGEIVTGGVEEANRAVESAQEAWPAWANTPVARRAGHLETIARYIVANESNLAELLVLENGKLRSEAIGELRGAVGVLRFYASLAEEFSRDIRKADARGTVTLSRQPTGVVSVIVPWNAPVQLGFLMIAPGIVAGNCLVVKPSNLAPLTLTRILVELAQQLPPGVLNIVPGGGTTVGAALVSHPKVRKISFTGSTAVGRTIMEQAARTLKNVSMELGGNDAAIILKDADLDDRLFHGLAQGVFTSAGQICYAVKRIYVHQDIYRTFLEGFRETAGQIRVGAGLDPTSTMGPVHNRDQLNQIQYLIEQAKSAGAVVEAVGDFVEGVDPEAGYFMLPHIVHDVEQSNPLVREEQFGPVVPIVPFATEDEAIQLANDTEFGLGNSIWTRDVERAHELAKRLQSGSVFLNVHRVGASAADMPFGGFKQSGIGRGHAVEGLHEHTELQAIIHRIDM
ncbi:aldehyde dehydrogenase family protein [Alicyclobacillus fastidiosus]|uniref:Aldehyde dehydrogenase family protein n=1 Tax=Alicyclobacillus fastidiosus TaxID=392011 RepID=A0ABV5AGM6_9BACL|nr:aldehyde dehydrogenase family protein [Alicyclobacillus fastidiosus]WEH07959.1 aldehyde dehydrogenase family protein [Alicyclobacillus fastidiosus]